MGANMGCERGFCRRLILEERRLARSYIRNVLYKQYIYIYIYVYILVSNLNPLGGTIFGVGPIKLGDQQIAHP